MKYSLALLLLSSSLIASIGQITAIRGSADLQRGEQHIPVKIGTELEKHDHIKTAADTKLQIVFNDKTVISLGEKSEFGVDEYLFDDQNVQARFSIGKGFFKSITGKIGKIAPSHFKVKTANATIGVRGTTIIGEVNPKMDIIACTYGRIVVTNPEGSVIVNQGERTIVSQAKAPVAAQKVNRIILKQLDRKSDPSDADTVLPPMEQKSVKTVPSDPVTEAALKTKEEEKSAQIRQTQAQPQPTLEDIQKVVGTQKPQYEGRVTEGTTSYGAIRQDAPNEVKLGFDLGDATVSGNMKFADPVQQYDVQVGGRVENDGRFNFNSQNGYDGGGEGKLEGENYAHANGQFDFQEQDLFNQQNNKIKGKFETTRK